MAGIDHAHAPLEKRERMTLVRGQVQALLPQIGRTTGCACALLATCSRTELYLHAESSAPDPLAALCEALGAQTADYRACSVVRADGDAAHHLMRVAAGLDSQILGDDQIVTQVRDAAALAREAQTSDAVLDTLFRRAVTAGKRVRTETRLVGVPASAAAVGVRKAARFFGSLAGLRAVVIGNGEMGRLAAAALRDAGARVTVTLRTYRHGETVVPSGCETLAYDRRYEALAGADLAVSATTSPHFTITAEKLGVLAHPPRLLLDLAMPRDIEPAAAQDTRVTLLNLDDLGDLGDPNEAARAAAERIIREETDELTAWHDYRRALPVIAAIKDAAQERLRFDKGYEALVREGDTDGLAELAVSKTVDLIFGGLKGAVDAETAARCLERIRKGSGK